MLAYTYIFIVVIVYRAAWQSIIACKMAALHCWKCVVGGETARWAYYTKLYQFKSVVWGSNLCNVHRKYLGTDADIDFGTGNGNGNGKTMLSRRGRGSQLALLKLKIPLQWVYRKMKHIRLDQVEAFKSGTHTRHTDIYQKCLYVSLCISFWLRSVCLAT